MSIDQTIRWVLKPAVFLVSLGPLAWIVWAIVTGNLSADPLKDVTDETGVWVLRFLCITLAVTPLRRLSGWSSLIRFRRMFGLFGFFYGTVHFLIYLVADRAARLDHSGGVVAWQTVRDFAMSVAGDIAERPFITVGFTAWMAMLPLAATSTAGMIRRLGGRRWQALHRLIYVAAVAGVVHYMWVLKSDLRRPETYAALIALLLAFRMVPAVRAWRARTARALQDVRIG